ncbi:MAG: aldehyde dehydrogenase family protein [Cellulosilyticaceae bacterium]
MENLTASIQQLHQFFYTRKTYPISFRIHFLKRLKTEIINHQEEIVSALYADFKKPPFETYTTEIYTVLSELDKAIHNLKKWAKPKLAQGSFPLIGSYSTITPEPFGVCLIFSPFNYPFQLALIPLIGAISAGNCALLKPSELTPHTAKIISTIVGAVFKPHYVKVVTGGSQICEALLKEPFDYIFFTGSTNTGKKVATAAAKNLIPVTLELGGKNPAIIDYQCDIQVAAKRIAWGKFINGGQTCVAPDYVLVHESIADDFLIALTAQIKKLYASRKDIARVIHEEHYVRLLKCINEDKLYYGGHFETDDLYIEPTILYPISIQDDCMHEEIFGPILPVIPFSKLSSVIQVVQNYPKPLACYIFSKDALRIKHLLKNIHSGGGCINDTIMHVANTNAPFGGIGYSGTGAYHGFYSFKTFSHYRTILHSSQAEIPLRYPPYRNKTSAIKQFIKYKF